MKIDLRILALASCLSLAPGLWSVNLAIASEPPTVSGPMAQFSFTDPPRPVPQKPFMAADGHEVSLQDFKGHVLLVNFWATWCAPCVRELPSLDKLQRRLADEGLLVLAVSQDRGGAKVAAPFLKKLGVGQLGLFVDPQMSLGHAFGVRALPWTFLIDRNGRMIGQLAGYAEWDSDEAVALIRHYLGTRSDVQVEKTNCRCNPTNPAGTTGN